MGWQDQRLDKCMSSRFVRDAKWGYVDTYQSIPHAATVDVGGDTERRDQTSTTHKKHFLLLDYSLAELISRIPLRYFPLSLNLCLQILEKKKKKGMF